MTVAPLPLLRFELQWLAPNIPHLEPLQQSNGQCGNNDAAAKDAVHVKTLESEHLLDAEPGDRFQ